jgi:SAM-dependent methyltransferase
MAGKSSLTEIEADALGDVSGKTLLHLQCHFGQDSLSWARRGAKVIGIDFSDKAIETAREINTALGLDASFVQSDVYALPAVLEGQFDFVFSTYGAIPWLPDLEKWAAVVSHFLKPGGIFYLAEFHPTLYLFNFDNYKVEYGYFTEKIPYEEVVSGTYADPNAPIEEKEFFWNHALSEVITPLLNQGLQLLELKEYDFSPYKCFPNMVEKEPGRFVWGDFGVRLPHVFSVKMKKGE